LQEDEFELDEPQTTKPQTEAAFASPIIREDTGITDPIEALTNAIVQKVVESINTFSSFAELLENRDKVFEAMDTSKFREALAKESFAARIKGVEDVG
jgi:phage gp29-like protein